MQPITALTVAGSDSGGGAGIEADLRTFSAFGVHGTCAITVVTAQNTVSVQQAFALDSDLVAAQIEAVTDDFAVAATKTGLLATPATVLRVAELARAARLPHLVVDPVLVSSTGRPLMDHAGVEVYRDSLIPFAEIVTPNLREACLLADVDLGDVTTVDAMAELAVALLGLGAPYVLVKGGYFAVEDTAHGHSPDVLAGPGGLTLLDAPRVVTRNIHGTGCSLSAAIAAGRGLGRSVDDAVRDAKSFVLAAITGAASWQLGRGHGPIDHLGWTP